MKGDGITFEIYQEEAKKARVWIEKQKRKHGSSVGTIGDRWAYQFVPTGLGTIKYCLDLKTGEKECLSDLANW